MTDKPTKIEPSELAAHNAGRAKVALAERDVARAENGLLKAQIILERAQRAHAADERTLGEKYGFVAGDCWNDYTGEIERAEPAEPAEKVG